MVKSTKMMVFLVVAKMIVASRASILLGSENGGYHSSRSSSDGSDGTMSGVAYDVDVGNNQERSNKGLFNSRDGSDYENDANNVPSVTTNDDDDDDDGGGDDKITPKFFNHRKTKKHPKHDPQNHKEFRKDLFKKRQKLARESTVQLLEEIKHLKDKTVSLFEQNQLKNGDGGADISDFHSKYRQKSWDRFVFLENVVHKAIGNLVRMLESYDTDYADDDDDDEEEDYLDESQEQQFNVLLAKMAHLKEYLSRHRQSSFYQQPKRRHKRNHYNHVFHPDASYISSINAWTEFCILLREPWC